MVTIMLMGQLQTTEGERDVACQIPGPMTVRQLIQRQGDTMEPVLALMKQKRLLVTINKRIASEDTKIQDGDAIKLIAHDGMGGSGLAPIF